MTNTQTLRNAILAASLETSNFSEKPQIETFYIPLSHVKALRLNASVVVGSHGVGKSFWTAALQSEELRKLISTTTDELNNIEVYVGFADNENIMFYPNADVFKTFIAQNGDPYDLWRAVILRRVAQRSGEFIPDDNWISTINWVKDKPDAVARLMQRRGSWRSLILFDALDRISDNWRDMDNIVQGLLRAILWVKNYAGLYGKVFLREDQAERDIFNFPDASKLTATKAELSWTGYDLHGLLWQRLINVPDIYGKMFRNICKTQEYNDMWLIVDDMKRESELQRKAFEQLAGSRMGRSQRHGIPYTWLVNYLADGRGRTSPRSFLAAIRYAARNSNEQYPDYEYALHYESLKRSIQKASDIRVSEIAKDYPWVIDVLSGLKGINVPCTYKDLLSRWYVKFPGGPKDIQLNRLPAQHTIYGWEGIREDLKRLGLLEIKNDGRIDMPELYRVGFGLGRNGSIKH